MRFLLLAAAFIAPCCIDSFALQHSAPVRANAVRATSSSHRCCSSTVMTLPSSLNRLAGTVLLGGALLATGVVTGQAEVARADVSISPRCITGEGAQCDDLAEGNELIKSLQAKSAVSKDRYFQETLDKYNDHNFKDYFRAENKHMVKHKDGKYEILTNAEYTQAEKEGTVKNEAFVED
ncbi:unnamed protein product [Laminaria digitata]